MACSRELEVLSNGYVTFNPSKRDKGHAIVVRSDGKIVVSGIVQDSVDLSAPYYNPFPESIKKAVLLMRITPQAMPTGWEEETNFTRPGLHVYPNPVEDRFFVELPEGLLGELRISLTDLTGREVAHWNRLAQDRETVELHKLYGEETGV